MGYAVGGYDHDFDGGGVGFSSSHMSPSSQSSVGAGSSETVAELTRIVEVIGSESPNGISGGISAGEVVVEVRGSELLEDGSKDVVGGSELGSFAGSAASVIVGSKTSGVAVMTRVLVVELLTTSIVATITLSDGISVVVTVAVAVAVETWFVVLVIVCARVSVDGELAPPSTLTIEYAARRKFCSRTSSGRDVESWMRAAAERTMFEGLYRIVNIANCKTWCIE